MSAKGQLTTSDYLPYEEYQKLVDCLERDKNYKGAAYCIISFSFGLRVGDVLKIRWCQIIGQKNLVVTETKTGKTKRIPIGIKTEERLHSLFKKQAMRDLNSTIFVNKDGESVSIQYINKWLKSCKDKYNLRIENFSSHTFRKTLGRYIYNKMGRTQESLVLLNRIFRHSNINITMIYLGLRDDEISNVFNLLD